MESISSTKLIVYSSGVCGSWDAPRKRIAVNAFIMMMLAYSAMKNMAKGPAAYSTLKPDTSSDSPSVRSNGARLVSARVEINHIMARGQDGENRNRRGNKGRRNYDKRNNQNRDGQNRDNRNRQE